MHPKPPIIAFSIAIVMCGCGPSYQHYQSEGIRLLEQGRFGAARGMFEAAHAMVPENADNLCNLAACHQGSAQNYLARTDYRAAMREIDLAIRYYDRAVQSYPGYTRALEGRNQALEMRGLSAEALQTARWATRVVGPSAQQQIFLAREYAERGDADQALLAYRQAVAMEPTNPTPHWALGMFYLELNRRQEGIRHLQQAYRLDPTRTTAAETLQQLGAEIPETTAAPDQPS